MTSATSAATGSKESDDVGRRRSQDRTRDAETAARKGEGDRGGRA